MSAPRPTTVVAFEMETRPDSIFYLCQSERITRLADQMPDPVYHRQMLNIAETYRRLAAQLAALHVGFRRLGSREKPN
ncbi:MAG TPA: hypothetical protein VMU42_11855 [Candidatus Sulfotelmatobacter sp.]|nr:hypothetical protein [Candidatus Sulfotelmatobacter sp.]